MLILSLIRLVGALSHWLLYPFAMFLSFCEHFLIFLASDTPDSYLPCLSLGIRHFPKECWFFCVETPYPYSLPTLMLVPRLHCLELLSFPCLGSAIPVLGCPCHRHLRSLFGQSPLKTRVRSYHFFDSKP